MLCVASVATSVQPRFHSVPPTFPLGCLPMQTEVKIMASWKCPTCHATINAKLKAPIDARHCTACAMSLAPKKRSRKAVSKRKKKHARPSSAKK